jgi:hypothetical protein
MQCLIHVFKVNSDYSQEYADERYEGQESEFNRKYEWMDELVVNEGVLSVEETSSETYLLQGEKGEDEAFSFEVPNMKLYLVKSSDAPSFFIGASNEILLESKLIIQSDGYVLSLYLSDTEPFSNPVPGIYISATDFPKELFS